MAKEIDELAFSLSNYKNMAMLCHEVERVYKVMGGSKELPMWDEASENERTDMIKRVEYLVQHPSATPEQTHANWMIEKLHDDWKYGSKLDVEDKISPELKPYSELSEKIRAKNVFFHAVVITCLTIIGFWG